VFLTSELDGGELHGPAALPPRGKSFRCPLDKRLGGPQSLSGRCGEERKSLLYPFQESNMFLTVIIKFLYWTMF